MAEEQKPAEVPKEETTAAEPAVAAPTETKEETPAVAPEATTSTETPAAAADKPVETAAAPAEEAKKEEVVPVEDGQLEHKGSNFPKNFIYSKKYFWFGSDAIDPKTVPAILKDHHLASWVSETGKGLLFYSEKAGDKAAPHGAIPLADAVEPTTDGTHKFVLTSKGHKHTFKAASTAERDNWVSQLKIKIAEAKELAATVTESETYKKTLESFKPAAPVKKEEPKKEETPKAAEETATAPVAETPAVAAAAATEAPKEEAKEEPKRRSASRKRASIFGNLLGGGKKEEKKEDKEEPVPESSAAATTESPKEEAKDAPAETTEAAKEPEAAAESSAPAPESSEAKDSTKAEKEKPTPSKRTSIFGNLSFGRKKTSEESAPAPPAKEEPISENAPVIPAPETTEPLSAEVSSPANAATETTEAAPVTNGEDKKEMKSDKRKSSLPALFGKKKEPSAEETSEGEKVKSPNAFSKLRATIRSKAKTPEKAADKTSEDKPAEGAASAPKTEEEAKPAEAPAAAPATEEAPKETPVASTPAVTATA